MLLQIWADEDRTPPWQGEVDMVEAETGTRLRIQIDDEARRKVYGSVRCVFGRN